MKNEYIITEQELRENYGLSLSDYALDTTLIPAIIRLALGKCITRVLYLNDNFVFEEDIEGALEREQKLVNAFKKLQYQVIFNLIFSADNPLSQEVDEIICSDLRWGKINGYQKQIFVR